MSSPGMTHHTHLLELFRHRRCYHTRKSLRARTRVETLKYVKIIPNDHEAFHNIPEFLLNVALPVTCQWNLCLPHSPSCLLPPTDLSAGASWKVSVELIPLSMPKTGGGWVSRMLSGDTQRCDPGSIPQLYHLLSSGLKERWTYTIPRKSRKAPDNLTACGAPSYRERRISDDRRAWGTRRWREL